MIIKSLTYLTASIGIWIGLSSEAIASEPFQIACSDSQGVVLKFVGSSGVLRDSNGQLRRLNNVNILLYPDGNGGLSEIFIQGYRDIRQDELNQMSCTFRKEAERAEAHPRRGGVRQRSNQTCYGLRFLGQCQGKM